MMVASQCFAAAMTWHGELVWLCIWPPMTMQVRDYIAATSSHPSGTPVLAHGEEVETHPSPSMLYPDTEPWLDLTSYICELDLDQLWVMLRALLIEIAGREGAAPPQGCPQGSLRVPGDGGMAEVDDGQVTFHGRRGGDQVNLHSGLQVSLMLMQMLATSSACSQLG